MDKRRTRILVVDDELQMREMLSDYLKDVEGYTVYTAEDGVDALENVLPQHEVDLVLSDINMPKMKGFELLNEVRSRYPAVKRVLITAYNVEDYFEMAQKYDVGNILAKTAPFNFIELSATLNSLLTNDIFGIDRYFSAGIAPRTMRVKSNRDISRQTAMVIDMLPEKDRKKKLELVLVELLTNAVFHGARAESPADKGVDRDLVLPDEMAIQASVMVDQEKYGISVVDPGGRLSKHDVLFWLNRQVKRNEQGLPVGIFDSHGRGLYIARRYIDRLILNIDRDRKTEVIILNYYKQVYEGHKPLYINEV